jgi:hypothetical protein
MLFQSQAFYQCNSALAGASAASTGCFQVLARLPSLASPRLQLIQFWLAAQLQLSHPATVLLQALLGFEYHSNGVCSCLLKRRTGAQHTTLLHCSLWQAQGHSLPLDTQQITLNSPWQHNRNSCSNV